MSIINKKVYQHLDEIISLYNNLYHDQDNEELKQKLIHRIKKFDWNRFKNSIDYISHNRELILKEIKDLEHHRELILEKIKDLQQLQTGDLIEFDKLPESCVSALNFQDAKGIKRSRSRSRSGSRSGSGIRSRKFRKKGGSKIKNGKSRKIKKK